MQITTVEILSRAVLDTLRYFHYFRHPLYVEEIHKFLKVETDRESLIECLADNVRNGNIYTHKGMYSLEGSESIFIKRMVGAEVAAEKIKEAKKSASIIANFPFVKGICISGSLSKGYADESSDIDFFVITSAKRLWISRSFLHLFKKFTFLVNRQHFFCMNYFIDEARMCLDEQNIFTATEVKTLLPIYNLDICNAFQKENDHWTSKFLPNASTNYESVECVNCAGVKKIPEAILNWLAPDRFNNFLMRLTDAIWRRKWKRKNYPMQDYDLAMKTKWYVSKHHPRNYQKQVLGSMNN